MSHFTFSLVFSNMSKVFYFIFLFSLLISSVDISP